MYVGTIKIVGRYGICIGIPSYATLAVYVGSKISPTFALPTLFASFRQKTPRRHTPFSGTKQPIKILDML